MRHVSHSHRSAAAIGDDDVSELFGAGDPPQRPQAHLFRAADHVPARFLDVFIDQSVTQLGHRQAVRYKPLRIDQDANLPVLAAHQVNSTHTVHRLNPTPHYLVRDFRELAAVHGSRDHHGQNRIGIGIDLLNDGRKNVGREVSQAGRDLLSDVLGCGFDVAF